MKYFRYHDPVGNFGDDLNDWLWPRLFGDALSGVSNEWLFVGMGSLLNFRIPRSPRTVVFGSGIGYGRLPEVDETWMFSAVRGTASRNALALPESVPLGDPAILVPKFDLASSHRGQVALMPHHESLHLLPWGIVARTLGWDLVDASGGVATTIGKIAGAQVLITSAMHGAIVADALRVPWIAFVGGDHINEAKWLDWGSALGIVPELHHLLDTPIPRRGRYRPGKLVDAVRVVPSLRRLLKKAPRQLSNERRLVAAQDRLLEVAAALPDKLMA